MKDKRFEDITFEKMIELTHAFKKDWSEERYLPNIRDFVRLYSRYIVTERYLVFIVYYMYESMFSDYGEQEVIYKRYMCKRDYQKEDVFLKNYKDPFVLEDGTILKDALVNKRLYGENNTAYTPYEIYENLYKNKILTENNEEFVVLDVETNGISSSTDDLLSISLYDPQLGIGVTKYLPLDLQPCVLTTSINGINDSFLDNRTHLAQEEIDLAIKRFDFANKIILVYSGNSGFDLLFINKYLERHNLRIPIKIKIINIKDMLPTVYYKVDGLFTKDNLCIAMGIEGVKEKHDSLNDCILEWKIFERIYNQKLFFINYKLYEYNKNYHIPFTIAFRSNELQSFGHVDYPDIEYEMSVVYRQKLSKQRIRNINSFGANIDGIAIENIIRNKIGAKDVNDIEFMYKNKSNLRLVGDLTKFSRQKELPITIDEHGYFVEINEEDKEIINKINANTLHIEKLIDAFIKSIKNNVFANEEILSNELVRSDKNNFTVCDLSSPSSVCEIKSKNIYELELIINKEKHIFKAKSKLKKEILLQLYNQSKGRNKYIANIILGKDKNESELTFLEFVLYKIDFLSVKRKKTLTVKEKEILERIIKNPTEEIIDEKDIIDILVNSKFIKKVKFGGKFKYYLVYKDAYNSYILWDKVPPTIDVFGDINAKYFKDALKIIKENDCVTQEIVATKLNISSNRAEKIFKYLKEHGYIIRDKNKNGQISWLFLKDYE